MIRKPHLTPRYDCPPGNVYVMWDPRRDRYEITFPAGTHRLGFQAAREEWLLANLKAER